MEGCIAVRVQRAEIFPEHMQDLQSRGEELHVISCPEVHGEYGPYHFAASMEDIQKQMECHMDWRETDEEGNHVEGEMGAVPEDTQIQKEV